MAASVAVEPSGSDQHGKQNWRPEQKRMTTAPKSHSTLKSLCGYLWEADPFVSQGEGRRRVGKQRVNAPTEPPVYGSKHPVNVLRDNVGKGHCPAGTDNNLRRSVEPDHIKVGWRAVVRHMSPYERRRAGNAAPGSSHEASHVRKARRQRGSRSVVDISRIELRDSAPDDGSYPARYRVGGITQELTGVCMSVLDPAVDAEGRPRIWTYGFNATVANRTREIRLSGMTQEARGIVQRGSRIEAHRAIDGLATGPCPACATDLSK